MILNRIGKLVRWFGKTGGMKKEGELKLPQTIPQTQVELSSQRASLAYKIKGLIETPSQKISVMPLQHQLLDLINYDSTTNDEAKFPFIQLFGKGLALKQSIYNQRRILDARNRQKKMVFYPTKFITGQLFSIYQRPKIQSLIQGDCGISKTLSTILYKILNDYMVHFNILLSKYPQLFPQKSQLYTCDKIIYWNVDKLEEMDFSKDVFKKQLIEREMIELKKQGYFRESSQKKMKQFYDQKGMQLCLFVDHIDRPFAKLQKEASSSQDNQQLQMRTTNMKKTLHSQKYNFNRIIYISSDGNETTFCDQLNLNEDGQFVTSRLRYGEVLKDNKSDQQAKLELIDHFLLVAVQNYFLRVTKLRKQQKVTQRQFHMTAREALKNSVLNNQHHFYLTTLSIRKWIENTPLSSIQSINNLDELTTYLQQEFNKLLLHQMKQLWRKKMVKFIQKDNVENAKNYQFLNELYKQYETNKLNGVANDVPLIMNKEQMQPADRTVIESVEKILDRCLFKCVEKEIELIITPEVFFNLIVDEKNKTTLKDFITSAMNPQRSHKKWS